MNEFALIRYHGIKLNNVKTNREGSGSCCIEVAIGHNKRHPQHVGGEGIDHSRSHLNYPLFPDLPAEPKEVQARAAAMLADGGYTPPRADSIVAVECVFTLRDTDSVQDMQRYFADCADWASREFDGRILSADVHLDQAHPHCHAIILLPLTAESQSGSRLIGYKTEIARRTQSFIDSVARNHNLEPPAKRLTGRNRQDAANSVIARMRQDADACLVSQHWPAIEASIREKPEPFMALCGVQAPAPIRMAKTLKTLAATKGKGPKTAASERAQDRRLAASRARKLATQSGLPLDAYRHSRSPPPERMSTLCRHSPAPPAFPASPTHPRTPPA